MYTQDNAILILVATEHVYKSLAGGVCTGGKGSNNAGKRKDKYIHSNWKKGKGDHRNLQNIYRHETVVPTTAGIHFHFLEDYT